MLKCFSNSFDTLLTATRVCRKIHAFHIVTTSWLVCWSANHDLHQPQDPKIHWGTAQGWLPYLCLRRFACDLLEIHPPRKGMKISKMTVFAQPVLVMSSGWPSSQSLYCAIHVFLPMQFYKDYRFRVVWWVLLILYWLLQRLAYPSIMKPYHQPWFHARWH